MDVPTLRRPSALIPLVMSGASLALVLGYIATHGTARQTDEGAAAHLWQLLMVGQLPVIAYFAIRRFPLAPKRVALIFMLQLLAGLAAAAPVFLLNF